MKKSNKILSALLTLSACTNLIAPMTYANGEGRPRTKNAPTSPTATCLRPEPATPHISEYYYDGMYERWLNAYKTSKPAAEYCMCYDGPGAGYGTFGNYEYRSKGFTALILLNNEAARQELMFYYAKKNLKDQVKLLQEHPRENLFMIWHDDLEEISKNITLYTGIKGGIGQHDYNVKWLATMCSNSRLINRPVFEDTPPWLRHQLPKSIDPEALARHRDLRTDSQTFGKTNYALDRGQNYIPVGWQEITR